MMSDDVRERVAAVLKSYRDPAAIGPAERQRILDEHVDRILALLGHPEGQEPVLYIRRKLLDAVRDSLRKGDTGLIKDPLWLNPDDEDIAVHDLVPLYASSPEGEERDEQGDVQGKARAWSAVYALCRELGMWETPFPRTEASITGQGTVLDFIRFLYASSPDLVPPGE